MKKLKSLWQRALTGAPVVVALGMLNVPAPGGAAFSEASGDAGIDITQTPSDSFQLAIIDVSPMIGGGAVGDFNNDGWQDLYIVAGGAVPDRLYINNGDGTFTDRAEEAGLGDRHMGVGAAVGDYNNDGWLDIFVTSYGSAEQQVPPGPGEHKLWRNNGDGTFTNVADEAGVDWSSENYADGWGPAFGDYDLDGDLDLFVPHWLLQANVLFRNNGDGTFTDVSDEAGVHDSSVRGFSARFADMNGDLYPELLLAADFGTSQYYVNNGDGTFTVFTEESGTGLDGNGMGQTVADFNRDGRFDWYVTSVHSVNSGMPSVPGTGNMLYMGAGVHTYSEESLFADVNDGGWGWGTESVDIDHDGAIDLIETNGWYQPNGDGDHEWDGEQCYVWRNNGNGTFVEIAQVCGFLNNAQGRGLVRFDYDNDGDQDIVVCANGDPLSLKRNDLLHDGETRWLRLFLDTSGNPRLAPNGYGTRIEVTAGSRTWRSLLAGGSNYLSQSELSVHFGLGQIKSIAEVRIFWNDGTVTVLEDLAPDQTLTVVSGDLCDLDDNGVIDGLDLMILIGEWGRPDSFADVNGDDVVNVFDLLIVFRNWS